jgi:hypothetical protein
MHEAAHPHDNPSSEHAEIMDEAARRIQKLEAELQAWKAAADGGSLLKQLIELIEAHEITCFSCDRDGEKYCDCLERMVKRCKIV